MMEILFVLREGPMIPNRIAQVCNLNYQRAIEMLDHLEQKELVAHEVRDNHDFYLITPAGLKVSMQFAWVHAVVMGGPPTAEELGALRRPDKR